MIYIKFDYFCTPTILRVEGFKKIEYDQSTDGYAVFMEMTDENEDMKLLFMSKDYEVTKHVFDTINNILRDFFNQSERKDCYIDVDYIFKEYIFDKRVKEVNKYE